MTDRDDERKRDREERGDGEGRNTEDGGDRDDWTPDAEKPQRERDVTTDDPGGSVPEGGTDAGGDFEPPLEAREFPVTTDELTTTYGDYRVDTDDGSERLAELLEPADGETFGSPDEVRRRIDGLADRG